MRSMTGSPFRSSTRSAVSRRFVVALAAVAFGVAACGGSDTTSSPAPATAGAGESAAGVPQLDFTAPELRGAEGVIDGGSLEGKDVVVWFWAPW